MREFAVNAVTALHLNELAEYVPNLRVWLLYLSAVLGVLCCFFGYKLRKLWFAAVCLVFGCIVGCYLYSFEILDINFSIVVGLFAATLFVFTYRLAAPEIGFCIAFYLSVTQFGLDISAALIPGCLLAVAAIFLGRWVITLSTAVFGAFAVVNLLPRLPLPNQWELPFLSMLDPVHRWYFPVMGGLAVLGFLIQFGFGSSAPLIQFRRK